MGLFTILLTLAAFLFFIRLTFPVELRRGRWWKISVSLPLVWTVGRAFDPPSSGVGALLAIACILALMIIWTPAIANFSGLFFSSHRRDYKNAREKMDAGELEEALRLARSELARDWGHCDFEGLLLVSAILLRTGCPENALGQVERLLDSCVLSEEQRTQALALKTDCLKALKDTQTD